MAVKLIVRVSRYDLLVSALYPNTAHGLKFRHM